MTAKRKKKAATKTPGDKAPKGKSKPGAEAPSAAVAPAAEGQGTADVVKAEQERFLRLQADFENFRKRTLRERNELYRRANEDLMLELLPVLDHLDLALEAARKHEADEAFFEGFRLVAEQMLSALAKFGLHPIDAAAEEFDPNRHEAISHLPSAEVPENRVLAQVRRGYELGALLLRAAQVVVSSGAPAAAPEPSASAVPEAAAPAPPVVGPEEQG